MADAKRVDCRMGAKRRWVCRRRFTRAVIYMPGVLAVATALLGRGATDAAEQGGAQQCQSGRCEDADDRATDIAAALEGVQLLWPFSVYHAQLADPAAVQVCAVGPRANARTRARSQQRSSDKR